MRCESLGECWYVQRKWNRKRELTITREHTFERARE